MFMFLYDYENLFMTLLTTVVINTFFDQVSTFEISGGNKDSNQFSERNHTAKHREDFGTSKISGRRNIPLQNIKHNDSPDANDEKIKQIIEAMKNQPGATKPNPQKEFASRFTRPNITMPTSKIPKTTLAEPCDYLAYTCMRAYKTGRACGRTLYYRYYTFKSYCQLDYVNCMEGFELWQVAHMGECIDLFIPTSYEIPEFSEHFLDANYAHPPS